MKLTIINSVPNFLDEQVQLSSPYFLEYLSYKFLKLTQVFVHLSTAYCHLNERVLYEKPYPPPASPHHVIKCCEWMSEDVLDSITPK